MQPCAVCARVCDGRDSVTPFVCVRERHGFQSLRSNMWEKSARPLKLVKMAVVTGKLTDAMYKLSTC